MYSNHLEYQAIAIEKDTTRFSTDTEMNTAKANLLVVDFLKCVVSELCVKIKEAAITLKDDNGTDAITKGQ